MADQPQQQFQDAPLGVSYTLNDVKIALADEVMRSRAFSAALQQAQQQAPAPAGTPLNVPPGAPPIPEGLALPADEQDKIRAAFGLPAEAEASLAGTNGKGKAR